MEAKHENVNGDYVFTILKFTDGSLAAIIYSDKGDTSLPKERIEVFCGGRAAVLDDFTRLSLSALGSTKTTSASQDKGHKQQITAFIAAVTDGAAPPIEQDQLIETSAATIAVVESLRTGERIKV